jgi:hypothetical protein
MNSILILVATYVRHEQIDHLYESVQDLIISRQVPIVNITQW